jgi:methylmalonyl-CoA mutase
MAGLLGAAGYDCILVETPGTGQTGLDLQALRADLLVYVKTREYGGAMQLQKDQLLRDADLVVLNKADLDGAEAAFGELQAFLRDLGREGALFPSTAKTTRDPGLDNLFAELCGRIGWPGPEPGRITDIFAYAKQGILVPHRRRSHLAGIADRVRAYDRWAADQAICP